MAKSDAGNMVRSFLKKAWTSEKEPKSKSRVMMFAKFSTKKEMLTTATECRKEQIKPLLQLKSVFRYS